MIKSEKKILAIEIILSIFFFLNIFFKKIVNDYLVIIILLITSLLIYLSAGYEKDTNINGHERRKLLQYVTFYCLGFLIMEYGLGLLIGYVKTPYKRNLLAILQNSFPTILIILLSEHLRYMIIKKGSKKNFILFLTTLLFILIDLTLNVRYYDLKVFSELLELICAIFLPSLFNARSRQHYYVKTRIT